MQAYALPTNNPLLWVRLEPDNRKAIALPATHTLWVGLEPDNRKANALPTTQSPVVWALA